VTPYDLARRRAALRQIMRAIVRADQDLMESSRTRDVLCEVFDRELVLEAWGEAMRTMKDRDR
jgi:hypothetical protein